MQLKGEMNNWKSSVPIYDFNNVAMVVTVQWLCHRIAPWQRCLMTAPASSSSTSGSCYIPLIVSQRHSAPLLMLLNLFTFLQDLMIHIYIAWPHGDSRFLSEIRVRHHNLLTASTRSAWRAPARAPFGLLRLWSQTIKGPFNVRLTRRQEASGHLRAEETN